MQSYSPTRISAAIVAALFLIGTTPTALRSAGSANEQQIRSSQIAVEVVDYVTAPLSSRTRKEYPPKQDFADQLARLGMMRSEPPPAPGSATRFFVADLNRELYILDKATRTLTSYINFEEVFPRFSNRTAHGVGLGAFVFDPEYAQNGRFYTVHSEIPAPLESAIPSNATLRGLDVTAGYKPTTPIDTPDGKILRYSVIVEWTDSDSTNARFEGTAREIIRIGFSSGSHPVANLLFNPTATRGHDDYGNLYIALGDYDVVWPPRLDALPGKILRITPDVTLRPDDELSPSRSYRVPTAGKDPNPFVTLTSPKVRKEIFAYGLRNPQRLSWDPVSNVMFVADIGEDAWEEVNLLKKGAHYGFGEREGNERFAGMGDNRKPANPKDFSPALPAVDTLAVAGLPTPVAPVYPVTMYGHRDGDGICGGFVYRGARMPVLRGKYVFGDISTGRLFFADLAELLAADDGNPQTMAPIHAIRVLYDSPHDKPDMGQVERRVFDIVKDAYAARGGRVQDGSALPGANQHITNGKDHEGVPYGRGRADIRLAVDVEGELYILSKSDGMIRALVSARILE